MSNDAKSQILPERLNDKSKADFENDTFNELETTELKQECGPKKVMIECNENQQASKNDSKIYVNDTLNNSSNDLKDSSKEKKSRPLIRV